MQKDNGRPLFGNGRRPMSIIGKPPTITIVLLFGQLLEVGLDDSAILGGQTTRQLHQRPGALLFGELAPDLGDFLDALLIDVARALGRAAHGVLLRIARRVGTRRTAGLVSPGGSTT